MNISRLHKSGAVLLALVATVQTSAWAQAAAAPAARTGVPQFEFDATWPKTPFPNEWIFGEVGGIDADERGHVWVIQRPWTVMGRELAAAEGQGLCCRAAPPVIEIDAQGNVVQSWPALQTFKAAPGTPTGQGFQVGPRGATLWEAVPGAYGDWGRREHTVYVDHKGFVWVTLDESHVVYKFTRDGKHVLTIGEKGVTRGSNDTKALGRPAGLIVDPATNELFVSDGYTNKRVIVFDAETGAYKRHWGAYGNKPEDVDLGAYDPKAPPAKQFRGPVHGIAISNDGFIYVADRSADRIQVFRKNGEYVKEGFVSPETRDLGTAYGVAVSHDPQQQWLYVNDGSNNKIWILDRQSLQTVGNFSSYGRNGGQVISAHSMAVDQQGNIYVGETRGRRVQKWTFKGVK